METTAPQPANHIKIESKPLLHTDRGSPVARLAIGGACVCWAIDDNCASKVLHVEASTLAAIKGVVAGVVNVSLVFIAGAHLPPLGAVGVSALIGLLGYGVSLVLFVLALREIGAARAGAYFSTAPFIGAFVGLLVLREPWSVMLAVAGALMAFGVWLHLAEQPAPGRSAR